MQQERPSIGVVDACKPPHMRVHLVPLWVRLSQTECAQMLRSLRQLPHRMYKWTNNTVILDPLNGKLRQLVDERRVYA